FSTNVESMHAPLLYPILDQPPTPCALSLIQYILVLGFTSKSSPFRISGLVPMLSYIFLALRNSEAHRDVTHRLFLIMSMGGTAVVAFQYLDSALLSCWTYAARGPTSALGGQKHLQRSDVHDSPEAITSKLVFGWEEAFRARSASSPWEVPNVPKFYPTDKNPKRLPTKAQFLRYAALRCLVSFCVLDVIGWMGRDGSMNAVHFASERIPLFTRWQHITAEELMLRLVCSILHWVVAFCVLQGLYYGAAVVVVGFLGWGKIERWPPLFNRITYCWSIRRFWGYFWHQGTRQKFVAPAYLLTFSALRIQHDTILARYTVLTLTFVISGIFHQLADVANGVPWWQGKAVPFFAMQAVGIVLEDTVQGIYRWVYGRKRTDARPVGWKLGFGCCWVLVWLFWTTPLWAYPIMQRSSGEAILPFSLVSSFVK
ncbi:MAG: hypothetical protein Q9182_004187, partial [Xanthomendoza sp. 2 TL-2023]